MSVRPTLPIWTIGTPVAAWVFYFANTFISIGWFNIILALALIVAVLAAVHHAEIIAHRVGEPYGSLVLAVAVTVIEVSLIVSLMLSGGPETATLARDTVFAAVMIILTGMIGLCLLIGGHLFREQVFAPQGVSTSLIALTAITVLTLILPNYTTTVAGPVYSSSQLIFAAIISLVLYGSFVMMQTIRHRDYFLPPQAKADVETHAPPPTNKTTLFSLALLLLCLGVVVLLAKKLSPVIETGVVQLGAPKSLVGIIVAFTILLPEGLAALRAARNNRLQTSLNLALGSALASIGLTIPAVGLVSIFTGMTVTLGIDAKSAVLLFLALFIIMVSFVNGRTNVMQGIVLLVIFAVYLFTTVVP